MLKKSNTPDSQVVISDKKQSSIPNDFEPVARVKQDEEKDEMFKHMGDSENLSFILQKNEDDDLEDDYHEPEKEQQEDILHTEEEGSDDDE